MNRTQLNILFIEDNPDDVDLTVLELSRNGFEINWQRVDTEAHLRQTLSDWKPDVILSDYSMPSFNGMAALEVTRALAPAVPFIFISGTIGEELAIESIRKGATDYVLKDNLRRLSTAIKRAITDSVERQRTAEVEKERSRLITMMEATSDLVAIASPDDSILYLNQGGRKLLGLTKPNSELSIQSLHAPRTWQTIRKEIQPLAVRDDLWQGDAILLAEDGTEIPVSQVMISHKGPDGEVEYFSYMARDIRDRKAFEKKIQYLANYDPLTGLPNRSLLADRLAQAINYCDWTYRSLALVSVNIDRFKLVNDGYGQDIGNALLKQVGERLKASLRARDTIAHLSADTFIALATELSAPDDAAIVIAKIQKELHKPFLIDGLSLNITVGVGVSTYPRDGGDFATLLQNADIAMHQSKVKGEGSFQFYASEMTRVAAERVRLEHELRFALVRNELQLYYQPLVSLTDESIAGFEALMRWNHPEKGVISPDVFIPIAESSELIHIIGKWALATACRQLVEWNRDFGGHLKMSVNVSARQFRSEGFADIVKSTLLASGLAPDRLKLELTETVLVHDHEEAARILNELNALGVGIALDDFGTGYSNLSYLSRLPIDWLKIDKSFVGRSHADSNDAEIVRVIISLAEALGLKVIAEGIESEEQLKLLQSHGCDEGQGYLFARPSPATKIPSLLEMTVLRAPVIN
jgi:diguanylate cyclase (GGDEF)-like protein/PAS domain S-box-containing protein